jgi:hypothetical protein
LDEARKITALRALTVAATRFRGLRPGRSDLRRTRNNPKSRRRKGSSAANVRTISSIMASIRLVACLSETLGVRPQIALAISAFVTAPDNRSRDGRAFRGVDCKVEESISITSATP